MKRLLPLLLLVACTAPDSSRETLQKAGYENIEITGYAPLNCGEDDTFSTGFTATNPKGEVVEGVVCCGLITKKCTIRF